MPNQHVKVKISKIICEFSLLAISLFYSFIQHSVTLWSVGTDHLRKHCRGAYQFPDHSLIRTMDMSAVLVLYALNSANYNHLTNLLLMSDTFDVPTVCCDFFLLSAPHLLCFVIFLDFFDKTSRNSIREYAWAEL